MNAQTPKRNLSVTRESYASPKKTSIHVQATSLTLTAYEDVESPQQKINEPLVNMTASTSVNSAQQDVSVVNEIQPDLNETSSQGEVIPQKESNAKSLRKFLQITSPSEFDDAKETSNGKCFFISFV